MPSVRTITKSRSSPGRPPDLALHEVLQRPARRRACGTAPPVRGPRPRTRAISCVGQRTAPAVVAGRLPAGPRRAAPLLELLGRAVAAIGVPPVEEPRRRLARRSRSARTAGTARAVRRPPGPRPSRGRASAGSSSTPRNASSVTRARVGVLDPQDERAAVVPGPEPREQGASRVPDVQGARRRGREPAADGSRPAPPGSRSVPMPSTSTSTTSPATILPTPSGVPVRMHVAGEQRHERR